MISGSGFVGDALNSITNNTIGRIPGVGGPISDVITGANDFVFGTDATPAGGQFAQNIQNLLGRRTTDRLQNAPQFQFFTPGQEVQSGLPELQFNQRNPFQFNFAQGYDPRGAVGDAFTPEIQRAQRALQEQGAIDREALLGDLNRRGLATSGITTQALLDQQRNQQSTLADIASRLAADQARQQLQSQQFGSGLQQNQQLSQAAELFRQQGATDEQALALANDAFRRRNQGIQEFMLPNQQIQQQEMQLADLARLSGALNPAQAASGGLVGQVLPAIGQAIGGGFAGAGGLNPFSNIGSSIGGFFGGNSGGPAGSSGGIVPQASAFNFNPGFSYSF